MDSLLAEINLLHQFALANSDPNSSGDENHLNAELLSMADPLINVNSLNDERYSPLHLAVLKNDVEMVKNCLVNIDLNAKSDFDTNEYTALHLAAKLGHLSIVQKLLINGADLKHYWSGETALCFAARKGQLEVIELLISKGADVNVMAEMGTPLHYAAYAGKLEAVILLASYGASLDIRSIECLNMSVLHFAAQSGDIATVEFLVSIGADLNAVDDCGLTPLCYAAELGNLNFIKQLLDIGEKYKIRIESNTNLLLSATKSFDLKTIEFFLKNGGNVNAEDEVLGPTTFGMQRIK